MENLYFGAGNAKLDKFTAFLPGLHAPARANAVLLPRRTIHWLRLEGLTKNTAVMRYRPRCTQKSGNDVTGI